MTPFDQYSAACRCEWGVHGLDALAPADVIIVVDVLSFSTCVDVAVSREVAIMPYAWKGASAEAFARANGAELAGRRGEAQWSLSPASFHSAPAGLRCVLPSPNGSTLTLRAADTPSVVLAGCLRNASAVAAAAARLGATFSICPAGEQWPDGSLRPAIEDWIAAGAILRCLPGSKSAEAAVAIAAFEHAEHDIREVVAGSSSGRELIARGFEGDVDLAADFDVSKHVPRFDGRAFIGHRDNIA